MTAIISSLATKQCKPCEGNVLPLSSSEITALMQQLDEWELFDRIIGKVYNFKNSSKKRLVYVYICLLGTDNILFIILKI